MGLTTIRKILMSFVFALMLIPTLASASTEFKGTETVNINKANAATLSAYLKGVGPSKADAIVKYRRANGKFSKIDDLKNVPGIGEETYKDVKKNVSTSRGKSVAPKDYKMPAANSSSSSSKKKLSTKKKKTTSSSSSSSTKKKSSKIADTKKSTSKKSSTKKTSTSKKTTSKKSPTKKSTSKKSSTKKTTTKKKPTKTKKKKTTKKKTTKK